MVKNIVPLFLAFAVASATASSGKCYVCSSLENHNCEDPFVGTLKPNSLAKVDCEGGCGKLKVDYTEFGKSKHIVFRGCLFYFNDKAPATQANTDEVVVIKTPVAYMNDAIQKWIQEEIARIEINDVCEFEESNGIRAELCICKGNLCNAVDTVKFSLVSMMICLTAVLLM